MGRERQVALALAAAALSIAIAPGALSIAVAPAAVRLALAAAGQRCVPLRLPSPSAAAATLAMATQCLSCWRKRWSTCCGGEPSFLDR